MDLEYNNGQMVQNTKVSMLMVKKMVKVNFFGQIIQFIKVNLIIIIFMDSESIYGMMEGNIKVNGKIIKCKEKENLYGRMEDNISEVIYKIKNMVILFRIWIIYLVGWEKI